MHLIDNGNLEIEVEISEDLARAGLAAAQEVLDDAGVTAAEAWDGKDGVDERLAGLWAEADQAALTASGGEAHIALAGTAAAFAESLTTRAHEAERAPFSLETPIGGFEPEGPEFL
jgi:acetylglutamate kinase